MQIRYRDPDHFQLQRVIFEHLRTSTNLERLMVKNFTDLLENREEDRGGLGGDQAPQVNKKQSNNYFIHFVIYFIQD